MLTLIAPSTASGPEALSILIRQEISQAQSLLSFYKNKYGMCSEWPFETFLHMRDKIFVCLIHIRSYTTAFPATKDFLAAEQLLFDTFELFDVNKVFESK